MKYAIWNKTDTILTSIGEVLSPEKWIERYPIAGLENITVICAAGEINGAFFGTLGSMVDTYKKKGADFTNCITDEEKINVINEFDELSEKNQEEAALAELSNDELSASSLASIAASLEYQNLTTLDDVEIDDGTTEGNVSQGVAKVSGDAATASEEELSIHGERISAHLESGLWSIPMVKTAVKKGVITKDEFQLITGNEYK